MNKKRISAVFICIVVLLLSIIIMLTSCKSSSVDTNSQGEKDTVSVENNDDTSGKEDTDKKEDSGNQEDIKYQKGDYTLPITTEPLELVWMGRDSEEAGTSFLTNKSIVWEEVQKRTGIKIKWDVVPNQEYNEVMQVRLASKKDLPDIICLQGQADGSYLVKYATEEVVIPLNDLIKDYAPNIERIFEEYPTFKNASTLPDGSIVAIAGDLSASKYRTKGVTIRKDWLDKVGLEEVNTIDELFEAAKAFIDNDPNGNGEKDEIGIVSPSVGEYRQLGMAFGLSLVSGSGWSVDDNNKVVYEFISPEYKAFLEWMHKAYKEGIIPKDFQTADGNVMNERITSDKAGIIAREYITSHLGRNDPESSTQKNTPGAIWMPIDFKDTDEYKVAIPTEPIATIWRSYGITPECKDKVAAIRLLDYVFVGEGRVLSAAGIEGLTYKMVNDKIVPISDWREKVEPGTFLGDSYSPKFTDDSRTLGGLEAEYLADNPELKDWSLSVMKPIAEKAYQPFQPPIPKLEDGNRIAELFGDLNTYRDEMYIKFITGERSLEEYSSYVADMEKLGCNEIRDIYQKSYDRLNK